MSKLVLLSSLASQQSSVPESRTTDTIKKATNDRADESSTNNATSTVSPNGYDDKKAKTEVVTGGVYSSFSLNHTPSSSSPNLHGPQLSFEPSMNLSSSSPSSTTASNSSQSGVAGKLVPSAQVCSNCGTTRTPLWRRAPDGSTICNACGLYLKSRNTPRPISLKNTTNSNNNNKAAATNNITPEASRELVTSSR